MTKQFLCDGSKEKCMICPLNECIRESCEVDDEFIEMVFVHIGTTKTIKDRRAYHKNYYQQNRDRLLAKNRDYYWINREEIKARRDKRKNAT